MKAAVLQEPGNFTLRDIEKPNRPPGGALVELSGSLICGSDIKISNNGHAAIREPRVLGHEGVGTIVELDGEGAGNFVGQRVAIQPSIYCGHCDNCVKGRYNICENIRSLSLHMDGVFAEYVAVPAEAVAMGNLVAVPGDISDEVACLAEPLACVINGQQPLDIRPGESVLVIGAGPIGILNAELARLSGASPVLLAQHSEKRLALARPFGYDYYINNGEQDLKAAVDEITSGKGLDVVIVTAPARAPMELAPELLGFRGRLSYFSSLPSGDSAITIDSRTLHYKELQFFGASSSSVDDMRRAMNILGSGRVSTDKLITHRLPLAEIESAMALAKSGEALKVYIDHKI